MPIAFLGIAVALLSILAACVGGAAVAPTPDFQATITAEAQATAAALPTPTAPPLPTPTPAPTDVPSPTPSPTATVAPSPTPTPTPAPTATPAHFQPPLSNDELDELVQYVLGLINQDRAENGLGPVTLGTNPAAQRHAEEMLAQGYLSHWGSGGLKPYMRYTLVGGFNYEGENVAGPPYYTDPGIYSFRDPFALLKEHQEGLMGSPGHRANILRSPHKRVNIGIAYNGPAVVLVQQFEGDYIRFASLPSIQDGVLTLSGRTLDGFTVDAIFVWYDSLPLPLTLGQLGATFCYDAGTPAVFIRPPPAPGFSYTEDETNVTWSRCLDPSTVPPDTPPPDLSNTLLDNADPSDETALVPWVDADTWNDRRAYFSIEADIGPYIAQFGDGVYTVVVGAENGSKSLHLTNYSIFIQ